MSGARTHDQHDDHDLDARGEGSASPRTLWISGAGSGVGRATAVAAARDGWRLVLSGAAGRRSRRRARSSTTSDPPRSSPRST
ncbi:hypothetical protein [Clavibacter michiganensis]|uniref:hypothetical protein n=1 Tax=Clavibacter michiganensis TaxID=28447 RepID=UPI001FB37A80|nr:hypothetical protein [Clavibacter michiganensis]